MKRPSSTTTDFGWIDIVNADGTNVRVNPDGTDMMTTGSISLNSRPGP